MHLRNISAVFLALEVDAVFGAYLTPRATPTTTIAAEASTTFSSTQTSFNTIQLGHITSKLDPWFCYTQNFTQYFEVPKPTGTFEATFGSFVRDVEKDCVNRGALEYLECPMLPRSAWCDYTTAAPSSALTDWSSYASQASTWWSAHSSQAVDAAEACPVRWLDAGWPVGAQWLNITIALAACHAGIELEAHTTEDPMNTATTATALSRPSISQSATSTPTMSLPQAGPSTSSTNGAESVRLSAMAIIAGPGLVSWLLAI